MGIINKKKIKQVYALEEGKTYWIEVDTDSLKELEIIKDDLKLVAPKIKFIVASTGIKPLMVKDKN